MQAVFAFRRDTGMDSLPGVDAPGAVQRSRPELHPPDFRRGIYATMNWAQQSVQTIHEIDVGEPLHGRSEALRNDTFPEYAVSRRKSPVVARRNHHIM